MWLNLKAGARPHQRFSSFSARTVIESRPPLRAHGPNRPFTMQSQIKRINSISTVSSLRCIRRLHLMSAVHAHAPHPSHCRERGSRTSFSQTLAMALSSCNWICIIEFLLSAARFHAAWAQPYRTAKRKHLRFRFTPPPDRPTSSPDRIPLGTKIWTVCAARAKNIYTSLVGMAE